MELFQGFLFSDLVPSTRLPSNPYLPALSAKITDLLHSVNTPSVFIHSIYNTTKYMPPYSLISYPLILSEPNLLANPILLNFLLLSFI